ncbi:MAG: hypothetical protein U0235_03475 [Polyangiaceae bacterium]
MRCFSKRVAWLGLVGASLACTPAESPSSSRFVEIRRAVVRADSTWVLGVVDEPEPPGFTPSTEEEKKNSVAAAEGFLWAPGSRRVVTLVLLDPGGGEHGRFSHVDDTASIYLYADYWLMPVVGPRGEKLSQSYVMGASGIEPVGKSLPRVTRYDFRGEGGVLYTAPIADSGEGLVLPLSTRDRGLPVPLPSGVRGVKVITTFDKLWGAFLVARNDRWYLSRDPLLKAPPEREWTSVTETKVADGSIHLGKRADGTCDVFAVRPLTGTLELPVLPPMVSCDVAVTAVAGKVAGIASETSVAEHAREKETAARQAAASDAAAQARRAAEDQQAKALYLDLVKAKSYAAACRQGERMSASAYVDLVIERMARPDYHTEETVCAQQRATLMAAGPRERLQAEIDRRGIAVAAPAAAPSTAPARTTSSSEDPRAYDRYMKNVQDYVYGSGKGAVCPFADRSLCR